MQSDRCHVHYGLPVIIALSLGLAGNAAAQSVATSPPVVPAISSGHVDQPQSNDWSKETKFNLTLYGSLAFVTAWGIAKWDYGSRTPHAQNEAWFGAQTKQGGADKLGHFHLSHALANGLPILYEHWGFDRDAASRRGLWTSLAVMGYMEFGDSFSDYGFAYEDMVMNVVGAAAGYWLRGHDYWNERAAFRVEYVPDSLNVDFFTDYERTRYLLALRADTLFKHPGAKWVDLQLGYFARGYDTHINPQREWFIGIGLNLRTAAEHFGFAKTAQVFRYWQPPGISLQKDFALD